MQVKGFMPPKDGLSRETPTGRAVGRHVVWHNFLCCSGICYAFGYLYRICAVTEKPEMLHDPIKAKKTSPTLCSGLGIMRNFHPPCTLCCAPL